MSKMSQFFLSQQEAGLIPIDPEDYYEFYNRQRCSISQALEGKVEGSSISRNGSERQHPDQHRGQERVSELGGLHLLIQQEPCSKAVQNENTANGTGCQDFPSRRPSTGRVGR